MWNVKSFKDLKWNTMILAPHINKWYKVVNLFVNSKSRHHSIHRLVALAFIQNPENKPQVNHKNGIKSDNHVNNLEWVTAGENIKHAFDNWLNRITNNNFFIKNKNLFTKKWKENSRSKRVNQYSMNWEFIREWDSLWDITRTLWITTTNISAVCRWKWKSAGWFIWKYK